MLVRWSKYSFLDILLGWQGAASATRSRLLQVFCSGIRLRTLLSNVLTLLIVAALIITETGRPIHFLWFVAVALGGLLPRIYAARLRRAGRFDHAPEAKALVFVAISAGYGLIWGVGSLLLLPDLSGMGAAILLVTIVFGTIMGPYAAMPGILYVRLVATALPTLIAIALYMPGQVTLVSVVVVVWLALRTDAWRGYHRALRQQFDLQQALELRQIDLEHANDAKERANRSLKLMAETDPLTGVANRRQLMRCLDALQGPAGLVLFDIDRFKSINDDFGHRVGDAVLLELVALARSVLRKRDLLARLGGDEFAIMLPDMDSQGAWSVAERIRDSVEQCVVQDGRRHVRVTISLGIALIAPGVTVADPSALLHRADAVLYAAKRQGRNRIGTAESVNVDEEAVFAKMRDRKGFAS